MQLDNVQPACFQLWHATNCWDKGATCFKKFAVCWQELHQMARCMNCFLPQCSAKGWCHKLPCWPSSTILSTSNHRPNPHHLKFALFECLKFVKQSDFAMFVVESMWWFKRSFMRHDRFFLEIYQVLYYSVSSKDHNTFCKFFWLENFAKDGVSTYPADLPVRI